MFICRFNVIYLLPCIIYKISAPYCPPIDLIFCEVPLFWIVFFFFLWNCLITILRLLVCSGSWSESYFHTFCIFRSLSVVASFHAVYLLCNFFLPSLYQRWSQWGDFHNLILYVFCTFIDMFFFDSLIISILFPSTMNISTIIF